MLHQLPDSSRTSKDVDYFHDAIESLSTSAQRDVATLRAAGYEVELERPQDTFQRAVVHQGGRKSKIEWVVGSAFRFFPVEPDLDLGWRLNFWDVATNKVLALYIAGRSKVRDLVDIVYLHDQHLCLGALAWAAAGKDPGMTPEAIIHWARRNAVYRPEDLSNLQLTAPMHLTELKSRWMEASHSALELIRQLPPSEVGCLYLSASSQPACPEPTGPEFPKLTRHFGSVRGAWPRISGA